MLELKNVKKFYGDFLALDDISIAFPSKGVVGLLGVNGAGKTTLIRILSAYYEPDEGFYLFNGLDVRENAESFKKNVGYLPDVPPLYLEMSVAEHLCFCAELKGLTNAKEEIQRVSHLVSIEGRRKHLAGSLSKGYRQRLGIAMAILGSPSLVILDEPFVGLDPNQLKEMRSLIADLSKKSLVIFSSHILSEVEANCDGVLMLEKGRLVKNTLDGNEAKSILNKEIFLIELENERGNLLDFLKKLNEPRIKEVASLGMNRYEIKGEGLSEIRSMLLKSLMNSGFLVASFSLKADSLEELFKR